MPRGLGSPEKWTKVEVQNGGQARDQPLTFFFKKKKQKPKHLVSKYGRQKWYKQIRIKSIAVDLL